MSNPLGSLAKQIRFQEASAVLAARDLLLRLTDHRQTPRVPRAIRSEARALLRWFPARERVQALVDLHTSSLLEGKPGGKSFSSRQNALQEQDPGD